MAILCNGVVPPGDPRHETYMKSPENQFGRWRFERVLIDFKPDVVIDVRDYWMNSYQQHTPFRPYFHWVLMPTVDSAPQQEGWIDTSLHADAITTYSDFGRDTLGLINQIIILIILTPQVPVFR